jgi:RNA polymerase subunit RPABC4/transcription elongation factor Spt4
MATYKVPCQSCGELLSRDAHYCPKCESRNPFGFHCPSCLAPIKRGESICSSCGRKLITVCPFCAGETFVGAENCDSCGAPLFIKCQNKRCEELQFFENNICTACGKPIKNAKKQIEAIRKGGK